MKPTLEEVPSTVQQMVRDHQEFMLENYVVKQDVLDYVVPALVALYDGKEIKASDILIDFLKLIQPGNSHSELMTFWKETHE